MLSCLCVGIVKNINMVSFDTSAGILCHVFDPVNQKAASNGNHSRVHSNGVPGSGNSAGAGVATPPFRTVITGTIGCCAEGTQGNQIFITGNGISNDVLEFFFNGGFLGADADRVNCIREAVPVQSRVETVVSGSYAACRQVIPVLICFCCEGFYGFWVELFMTVTVTVWAASGSEESQTHPAMASPTILSKCPFIFEVSAKAQVVLIMVKSAISAALAISLAFAMFQHPFFSVS